MTNTRPRIITLVSLALTLSTLEAAAQDAPRRRALAPAITKNATKESPSPAARTRPTAAHGVEPAKEGDRDAAVRRALEAFGSWTEAPPYGAVWVPAPDEAGDHFVPFVSHGYWTLTDAGDFAWISDHGWGDLVFHYGDWIWSEERGWAWVPGTDYAPARVVWRFGEAGHDYVGWAPSAPARYWVEDAPAQVARGRNVFWFVPRDRFFRADLADQVVTDRAHAAELLEHSRVVARPTSAPPTESLDALLAHLARAGEARRAAATAGLAERPAEADDAAETTTLTAAPATPAQALRLYRESPYGEADRTAPDAAAEAPPASRTAAAPAEEPTKVRRTCRFTRTWPRRRICYYR